MLPLRELMLPDREVTSADRKPCLDLFQSLTRTLGRQLESMLQGFLRQLRIGLVAFIDDVELPSDSLQHLFQRFLVSHCGVGTDVVSGSEDGRQRDGRIGTVRVTRRAPRRGHADSHRDVCRKPSAEFIEEGGRDEHAAEVALEGLERLHGLWSTWKCDF